MLLAVCILHGEKHSATNAFEQNLDAELLALHRELTAKTYQPGEYVHFVVYEPKRRLISAAPFR